MTEPKPLLNRRVKESIKTALAMVIAYDIALAMDWDRPYWAAFAVALVSLASIGQSLNKAALRLAGTGLAVVVSFVILALFPQERWMFIVALSLWVGFCSYMLGGDQKNYFWLCAGFIVGVICADAGPSGEDAFKIAILRAQETALGVLVYGLIASMLWPVRTGDDCLSTANKLLAAQASIFQRVREAIKSTGNVGDLHQRVGELLELQASFQQHLDAAIADTYEFWEEKHLWRLLVRQTASVTADFQRWSDSVAQLRGIDLDALIPGHGELGTSMQQRYSAMLGVLGNQAPQADAVPLRMEIDRQVLGKLTIFEQAEIASLRSLWQALDDQTRAMFATVLEIREQNGAMRQPPAGNAQPALPVLDIDRLQAATRVVAGIWIAYLAWIYVPDLPAGNAIVSTVIPMALAFVQMPQVRVSTIFRPLGISIAVAGCLYMLVMPQLSSFFGLALLIFAFTFAVCYFYNTPQKALGRTFGLVMFVTIASISNEQTYSFYVVANAALMMSICCLILMVAEHIPVSPRPEINFKRLLSRYFRSSEFLMSTLYGNPRAKPSLAERLQTVHHLHEINTLPKKLKVWSSALTPELLPDGSTAGIDDLVRDLRLLSFRLRELLEARSYDFPEFMVTQLQDQLRTWRREIQQICARLAQDPAAIEPNRFRSALDSLMSQLEDHIQRSIGSFTEHHEQQRLTETDEINLLHLLAAYRGVSEALGRCTSATVLVDWPLWQEERFA